MIANLKTDIGETVRAGKGPAALHRVVPCARHLTVVGLNQRLREVQESGPGVGNSVELEAHKGLLVSDGVSLRGKLPVTSGRIDRHVVEGADILGRVDDPKRVASRRALF